MTKLSEFSTGVGPEPETGGQAAETKVSVKASAIETPLENAPRMPTADSAEHHRAVGEEQNPEATRGTYPTPETDFAELDDGRLIEMIEDPQDRTKSLFAVYNNGTLSYANTVQDKNHIIVPLRRQDQILKHMHFPRGVAHLQPVTTLLARICGVIFRCVEVDQLDAVVASLFVMSTYFIERLSVAPYLAVVGPPQSGKTTFLQLLNRLCRHALLTSDVTCAALYDVYEKMTPTLIVDETLTVPDRRALFHFLRAGSTRDSVTLRKGRSVKSFGPKVISATEIPNDPALVSRCIVIPMMESSRTDLAKLTDKWVSDAITGLQMFLLDYRLKNFKSLCLPKIDGDECLHSRTRDLYQALALPVGSEENICKFLIERFKSQEGNNREPLSPSAATTLRSLAFVIHSHPDATKLGSKELMMAAGLIPGALRLTAHEIGSALTALRFTQRTRTNTGYVLWLDLRTHKRIHQLAHDYGIDRDTWFKEKGFAANCPLCQELEGANRGSAQVKQD